MVEILRDTGQDPAAHLVVGDRPAVLSAAIGKTV
jgi:hypothetical protein